MIGQGASIGGMVASSLNGGGVLMESSTFNIAGQPLEIELSTRDDLGDADLTPGHALWLHPRKAHLFAGQAG